MSTFGSSSIPPVNPSREPRGDASRLDRSNKDRKQGRQEDPRQQPAPKKPKGSDSIQLSDDARNSASDDAAPRPAGTPKANIKRLDLNA